MFHCLHHITALFFITILGLCAGATGADAPLKPVKVLFLGDDGHHQPLKRHAQLDPVMRSRNIEMTYTANAADLNPETLAKYQCLLVYANTLSITPEQEKALLDFVENGGGFVPVHCASAMFKNSPKYIALVGGAFKSHKTGEFSVRVDAPTHPIMDGLEPFVTWDETYVHSDHNPDRTILQSRVENGVAEPWTWVRTVGKGRVFYTAYGHDQRTFGKAGFHALIERGIRWSTGDDKPVSIAVPREVVNVPPAMTPARKDVKPFEYKDADIPFYSPGPRKDGPRGADGWKKMQLPVDPAESIKHLSVPVGFEPQLFAAEPDVAKPICMTWDARGRLWIVETVDYPNDLKPTGEGNDRIKICEDTDGDGKADKFTIFADKLSIPTSIIHAGGGLIIHMAPHTMLLKDNDGDDKCDERKILFSGWGTGDTHAGPSNLRYGFDGWLWGIVGYSGFNGEVNGEKLNFRMGFYRFKPDGSKLEFLRSTNNNSWGVGFSEDNLIFGSTANGTPSVYLPIPNRFYESVRGWSSTVLKSIADSNRFLPSTERVRQVDYHGGFTAAAGHALYTARTLPKEYWNRTAFVTEPTGHLVAVFSLSKYGADFAAKNTWNLASSDDEWTAPIMAEVGPDGQMWMIDWYNFIVQHNPTPHGFKTGARGAYETPLRDKIHGRIYRLVNKEGKPSADPKLDAANPAGLVAALKSENLFWRLHAQRMLVERGNADVAPALIALIQDSTVDAIGLNPAAIHALWTLNGLKALEGPALTAATEALRHPSASVRRAAIQTLPRTEATASALIAAGSLNDADAQVRLAAFLAFAELPKSDAAAKAVLAALVEPANSDDRWIPEAATSAAAVNDVEFLKGIATRNAVSDRAVEVATRVAEHFARGTPEESIGAVFAALSSAQPRLAEGVLAGLAKGWPKGKAPKTDEALDSAIAKLMESLPAKARGSLVMLALPWGSASLSKHVADATAALAATVKDEKASEAARIDAAAQFIDLRKMDGAAAKELIAMITPRTSPALAAGLVNATSRSESPEVGAVLVDGMRGMTPATRQLVLASLLSRNEWTAAYLKAVEAGKADLSELSLDQKTSLSSHPNKDLAKRAKELLAKGGGLPDEDRQKVIDELSPVVLTKGDPAKGKQAFTLTCAKCHSHSGVGGRVGPDLTGMAVHPKPELLIHIIDPSRSVEGNFKQYTVRTNDGRVITGLLASESKTSMELLDTEGKSTTVQREEVQKFIMSTKSIMPEGFEKEMTPETLRDLIEFLVTPGKYVPLDISKAATIVSTQGMFITKDAPEQRLIFPDWAPKTFNGIPFTLVDPKGESVKNAIMLFAEGRPIPATMPKSVALECHTTAKVIHLLSGVSGWGYQGGKASESVTMIVRIHYTGGATEDHELKDGVHFSDYIRPIDVPESKLAFKLRGQQLRYLAIAPKKKDVIERIEFVKGPDAKPPVVMAVTVEPE